MKPTARKGMPETRLSRAAFAERFRQRFQDPAFDQATEEIETLVALAWEGYAGSRKSPRTRRAGPAFADPDYELSVEWLETRERIAEARARQAKGDAPSRILLVNGSSRSDQTCPGEMSKTYRMVSAAEQIFTAVPDFEVDLLDLSRLTSEYARLIHPCKACVSTAMPLCHWPCSCYPNHSLGQVNDWMNEIYPRWVAAHGIMIICPVNWYQAPSTLKLMIDRLVCADGGNPDPTTTQGKKPELAKEIELAGWDYPRHLAGRSFAVVVHGDAAGVETLERILSDWLTDMGLIGAGRHAQIGRYLGYLRPYATGHDDLDQDHAFQEEVRNAALALVEAVNLTRRGELKEPGARLKDVRPK
jgi:multimeric flavodoxin WrbA